MREPASPARRALAGATLGVVAALPLVALLRGFTVDDALVVARYATNVARGVGHRFDPGGPVTDGVTPLGFAYALAPFARGGSFAALEAARSLGVASWLVAAALVGASTWRIDARRARALSFALVATSAPLAAWAWGGLETMEATLLATSAALAPGLGAAALAGLVAWLRPEALPWALVMGAGVAVSERALSRRAAALALALAPFVGVALARHAIFGRAAPLSALAKPADLAHGARYALGCLLFTGAPLALIAPRALARADLRTRTLVAAGAAHLAALALAGGDWMALSRLMVPVLPGLVVAAARLAALSTLRVVAARAAFALVGPLAVLAWRGRDAANVLAHRRALVAWAAPHLEGASAVATVDVGWVSAATHARIVDLAGITDPTIAALPGGHTSKAVDASQLFGRGCDALVFERPADGRGAAAFTVERRLLADPAVAAAFSVVAEGPEGAPVRYAILRRAPAR